MGKIFCHSLDDENLLGGLGEGVHKEGGVITLDLDTHKWFYYSC